MEKFYDQVHYSTVQGQTRLGQLGANISPDRSSLTPQVLIGNFLFNPFVVCHKYWEKLYELQHINLLRIHNSKSVSLFLYLFTNKILFKNHILFILLFYYIIFRICIVFQLFISSIPIYVVHIYAT